MKRGAIAGIVLSIICHASILQAYDPETHREIGRRATQPTVSQLDQVLKDELGISDGVDQRFFGPSLQELRTVEQPIGSR